MSNTLQPAMEVCNHERRPGTTVCLHCRHTARLAARVRRKRLMLRGSAVAVVGATLGIAGILSAGAIRGRASRPAAAPATVVAEAATSPEAVAAPASGVIASSSTAPALQQGDAAPRPRAQLSPIIPQGDTQLSEGIMANRADSVVTLSFDTPMSRTRIPEKFEPFLRTTLARVYGAAVDSALAAVPAGSLARTQAALLYELPTRGIHIPLKDARQLAVYPEIRPGQDGPLVVRYRVSVVTPN